MAYTKTSLIQDLRNVLQDNPWETTSTTTGTGATVAVPDGTKWAVGDIGEWSFTGTAGGEQFLVQSIASNDLTTLRGYNGTTAESHSSGDRVVKNPLYSVIQLYDSIDRVIESLYPTAWKSVTTSVTPDTTTVWFDSGLTSTNLTGMIDLINGTQRYGDTSQYAGTYGPITPYVQSHPIVVMRNMPTALVTSAIGVRFPGGFHHSTNAVLLNWRARITTAGTTSYTDLDEGLLSEAVVFGTVARLLASKEVMNVSEDTRIGQAEPGSFVGASSYFELRFREVLSQYHRELTERIPARPDQNYVPGWW